MSDQVKLFTQADLADLNKQLDGILKNLNAHVNMSLSKAHAIKVVYGTYYDSGGDQLNKPYNPVTDQIMLEFQFGEPPNNTSIFVPARIVNSLTGVQDPGPRDFGTGITFTATGPTGTSTSPGVPLYQKSLVTTSPSEVALEQSVVYNDLLLMHQLCSINDERELQCHGGISYSTQTTLDSLGHTVGRRTVNLGYGGILYKIPGDTRFNGPPQGVRQLRIITNGSYNPYRNHVHHAKDDNGNGEAYLLTYYGNTATIEWQVNNSSNYTMGNSWHILNPGGGAASGSIPSGYGEAGSTYSITESPSFKIAVTFQNGSDDQRGKQFVRVKATTPQGAVTYSNVCLFSGNDEDKHLSGITWYGKPEFHYHESKAYYWTDWLPGASTLSY